MDLLRDICVNGLLRLTIENAAGMARRKGSPIHLASTPLSVPSSILTDVSLPAPTEPARDDAFVLTLRRDGTGMWTFGDGAAGDSAAALSRSSLTTDELSPFRLLLLRPALPFEAIRDTELAVSVSLEARKADSKLSAPSNDVVSPSESPSIAAISSSHILTFSRVSFISSSSSCSDGSSSLAMLSSVRDQDFNFLRIRPTVLYIE